ncbi:hypothetical protein ACFY12_10070 [Streptomyces sp. NPDC001339]
MSDDLLGAYDETQLIELSEEPEPESAPNASQIGCSFSFCFRD